MKSASHIQIKGELFKAVQKNRVFPDSKYFVDCVPKLDPQEIMDAYHTEKNKPGFDLRAFVESNFRAPDEGRETPDIPKTDSCRDHITNLWPLLFRKADASTSPEDTLIPLPHPYVVPGGRFREIYYWDSYFTSLGLATDGQTDMILNMTRNFAHLIHTVGHVPNGNRVYYLSRSQPPFFTFMVDLCLGYLGDSYLEEFLPAVQKEHDFWMDKNGQPGRRCIQVKDFTLNRYWDDNPVPREESWFEDDELAHELRESEKEKLWLNIRAACESGWDFTSRWFGDGKHLSTIETTNIIPIDLNALLWFMEDKLSEWYAQTGDESASNRYRKLADNRKEAIHKLMWNDKKGFFMDYHLKQKAQTNILSLAGIFPFFCGLADQNHADKASKVLRNRFLRVGGLMTTPHKTGQQWDKPNGWAPLQWVAFSGMMNYEYPILANDIKNAWLRANDRIFEISGKMVEKYNVTDITGEAGGGEYPLQDGFGWSNGVYAALSDD